MVLLKEIKELENYIKNYKELVKEFEGNFECLGENTEKYITFSAPLREKINNKNKTLKITYMHNWERCDET